MAFSEYVPQSHTHTKKKYYKKSILQKNQKGYMDSIWTLILFLILPRPRGARGGHGEWRKKQITANSVCCLLACLLAELQQLKSI